MANLPRITIVTPSYNQAGFIRETIRSVLDQVYPDLEYIIMDGGSTDGSVEIIQQYADRLTHWESHPDKGQADAVYRGFERSTGAILGYLNSDDVLLPGCLEAVGQYFVEHPQEEWVVGGAVLIGPEGRPLRNRIGIPICNLGAHVSLHQLLFNGCTFNQPASFWRRDSFFAVAGFDKSLQFCFDLDLYLRLARRCPSGRLKRFLACFRVHPTSKTSTIYDVRDAEREVLWTKYGRYQKSKMRQKVSAMWHAQRNFTTCRLMQARLSLGLLRLPV